MRKPKVLQFCDVDPLQDYYQDGDGNSYSVARLVDEAKGLKPFKLPLEGIDLDLCIWNGFNMYNLAFHIKRVNNADLRRPIILDWNGAIADGRHRILKAIVKERSYIKAVRLTSKLNPDRYGEK